LSKKNRKRGARPSGKKKAGSKKNSRRSSTPSPSVEDDDLHLNKSMRAQLASAFSSTESQITGWLEQASNIAAPAPTSVGSLASLSQLDDWQREAYEALMEGYNVVVDAPTTAGKTRVVESFFAAKMENNNFRAAYTTPVKSLSNDKLREFRETFGKNNVGIATGDLKENLPAPIIVTTLETYRNSLLGVDPDLNRNLVIFDEYHFMADGSRGSAWEEAIILTPPSSQLLLLSASVENGEEFVRWLEKIHQKPCKFIQTKHRPVPLTDLVYFKEQWLLASEIPQKILDKKEKSKSTQLMPLPHKHLAPRLVKLIPLGLTPCIIYAGRRKSTEGLARELAKILEPLPLEHREQIGEILQKEHEETKALNFIDQSLRVMIQTYGVAYHHSGLTPSARAAIEATLKSGSLRYCVATMGLSIGINFSVKSACISDYQRPGEQGFSKYDASETLQMLGRAGRRGKDIIGFSIWPSLPAYQTLAKAKRSDCRSRLKNDPTTFLGLVGQGLSEKDIENFYAKSFRRFSDSGLDLGLIRKSRVLAKLKEKSIPCITPAYEFANHLLEDKKKHPSLCYECPHRNDCHRYINAKSQNDLAALQLHLHVIGALDHTGKLSQYGEMAKYFPQPGGLLIAHNLLSASSNTFNLTECAELMACLSLARFKSPGSNERYKPPFDPEELEEDLTELYPLDLFPELYDPPHGQRKHPIIRDLLPEAGFAIKAWIQGTPWAELQQQVVNEKFAQGDLVSLMYRVASYLQSLKQANLGEISRNAKSLREEILRDPLSITT